MRVGLLAEMPPAEAAHVGLEITKSSPFIVLGVPDLMDGQGVLQGCSGYANECVQPGDRLLAVGSHSISSSTAIKMVHEMLSGELGEPVDLKFSREGEAPLVFTITVLRHGSHTPHPPAALPRWDQKQHAGDCNDDDQMAAMIEPEQDERAEGEEETADAWGILQQCSERCEKLLRLVKHDVLDVQSKSVTSSIEFATRSTVGLVLEDNVIHSLVTGGPAWNSGLLGKGDEIIAVDGQNMVSRFNLTSYEHLANALKGSDVAGTRVTLTVKKSTGDTKEVTLTRMETRAIADQRILFEKLTSLKEQDHINKSKIDEATVLWQTMSQAEALRRERVHHNVRTLQEALQRDLQSMTKQLLLLKATVVPLHENEALKTRIEELESAMRKSCEQNVLEEMRSDALKVKVDHLEAALRKSEALADGASALVSSYRCEVNDDHKHELERIKEESKSTSALLTAERASIQAFKQRLEQEREALVSVQAAMQQDLSRVYAELDNMLAAEWERDEQKLAKLQSLQDRVCTLQAENLRLQSENSALCTCRERADQVQAQLETEERLKGIMEQELTSLKESIHNMTFRENAYVQQVGRLEANISAREKEFEHVCADLKSEASRLKAKIQDQDEQNEELLQRLKEIETEQAQERTRSRNAVQTSAREEKERQQRLCEMVCRRSMRHQLSMSWNEFVNSVQTSKVSTATARQLVVRMQHRQLAGAFDCYAGHVQGVVSQRKRVARKLGQWKTPGLKKAFDIWLDYVDVSLQEHAQEAQKLAQQRLLEASQQSRTQMLVSIGKAEFEVERRVALCQRAVKRMLRQHLAKAWSALVVAVEEVKRNRFTVRRVMGRLQHQQVSAAFELFCERVAELSRIRTKCARIICRIKMSKMYAMFLKWQHSTAEAARVHRVLQRAVLTRRRGSLAKCWARWRQVKVEAERMMRVADRVTRRWRHMRVAPAMMRWRERTHEYKRMNRAKKEEQEIEDIGTNFVKINRRLSMCEVFKRWAKEFATTKKLKLVARRVVARWHHMSLAVPFVSWSAQVAERKRLCKIGRAMVRRWSTLVMAMPFQTWAGNVREHKRVNLAARKVVKRISFLCLARPWEAWGAHILEERQLRRAAELMVNRWRAKGIHAAFQTWHVEYVTARGFLLKRDRMVTRWKNLTLFSACLGWHEQYLEQKRLKRVADKMVKRWSHLALAPSFSGWRQTCVLSQGERGAVIKWLQFADVAESTIMKECVSEWAANVKTAQYARFKAKHQDKAEAEAERRIEMCKRVVKKMLRHQLSMAWNEFVDCVLTTKEKREIVRRVLARIQHRQLAKAFDCYHTATKIVAEHREQVVKSLERWRSPSVRRAIDGWLEYVDLQDRNHRLHRLQSRIDHREAVFNTVHEHTVLLESQAVDLQSELAMFSRDICGLQSERHELANLLLAAQEALVASVAKIEQERAACKIIWTTMRRMVEVIRKKVWSDTCSKVLQFMRHRSHREMSRWILRQWRLCSDLERSGTDVIQWQTMAEKFRSSNAHRTPPSDVQSEPAFSPKKIFDLPAARTQNILRAQSNHVTCNSLQTSRAPRPHDMLQTFHAVEAFENSTPSLGQTQSLHQLKRDAREIVRDVAGEALFHFSPREDTMSISMSSQAQAKVDNQSEASSWHLEKRAVVESSFQHENLTGLHRRRSVRTTGHAQAPGARFRGPGTFDGPSCAEAGVAGTSKAREAASMHWISKFSFYAPGERPMWTGNTPSPKRGGGGNPEEQSSETKSQASARAISISSPSPMSVLAIEPSSDQSATRFSATDNRLVFRV